MRVKICGIVDEAGMRAAVAAGADMIGLNFFPESPRFVEPRRAGELLRGLPPWVSAVGVFPPSYAFRQACATAYQLGLRGIQWYGPLSAMDEPFPFALIRVLRVKTADDLRAGVSALAGEPRPSALLIDALSAGVFGGTGERAPWELLRGIDWPVPLMLAGGLTPENVAEAIRLVRPSAVDVASGVESAPARKDPEKLRRFIETAQTVATSETSTIR